MALNYISKICLLFALNSTTWHSLPRGKPFRTGFSIIGPAMQSRLPACILYEKSFNKKRKKCVCSMGKFPDLMKLGAHGGLG